MAIAMPHETPDRDTEAPDLEGTVNLVETDTPALEAEELTAPTDIDHTSPSWLKRTLIVGGGAVAVVAAVAALVVPALSGRESNSSDSTSNRGNRTDQPIGADVQAEGESTDLLSFIDSNFSLQLPAGFSLIGGEPAETERHPEYLFQSGSDEVRVTSQASEGPTESVLADMLQSATTNFTTGEPVPGKKGSVTSVNNRVVLETELTIPDQDNKLFAQYFIFLPDKDFILTIEAESDTEVWQNRQDILSSFVPNGDEPSTLVDDMPGEIVDVDNTGTEANPAPTVGDVNGDGVESGKDYLVAALSGTYDMSGQRPEGYSPADYLTIAEDLIPIESVSTKADMTEAVLQRIEIAFNTGDTKFLEDLLAAGVELEPGFLETVARMSQDPNGAVKLKLGDDYDSPDEVLNQTGATEWRLSGPFTVEDIAIWEPSTGRIGAEDPTPESAQLRLFVKQEAEGESLGWKVSAVSVE